MFGGIIYHTAEVKSIPQVGRPALVVSVQAPAALKDLKVGASVAIDGACLTATQMWADKQEVSFDVGSQTLKLTSLCDLQVGDEVHFERSYRAGDELGGHEISGHIHGTCHVTEARPGEYGDYFVTFQVPHSFAAYLIDQGYIAVAGTSLTLFACDRKKGTFTVNMIPQTLAKTHFLQKSGAHYKMRSATRKLNFEIHQQTKIMVDVMKTLL